MSDPTNFEFYRFTKVTNAEIAAYVEPLRQDLARLQSTDVSKLNGRELRNTGAHVPSMAARRRMHGDTVLHLMNLTEVKSQQSCDGRACHRIFSQTRLGLLLRC